ncbi:MAG: hypothetical protein RL283_1576 [Actinomycetota bacterium]
MGYPARIMQSRDDRADRGEIGRELAWWIADAHGPTALAAALLLAAAFDALRRTAPSCGPFVRVRLATATRRWGWDARVTSGLAVASRARRDDATPLLVVVGDASRASVRRELRPDELVPVVHLPELVGALESAPRARCDDLDAVARPLARQVPNVSWYHSVAGGVGHERLADDEVGAIAELCRRAAGAMARCDLRGGEECRIGLGIAGR